MNNWCVYIVECADKTLYTGVSKDVDKRIITHNSGKGAAFTRARLPVCLLYFENSSSYSDALKRESQIKKWSRLKKLNLIKFGHPDGLQSK